VFRILLDRRVIVVIIIIGIHLIVIAAWHVQAMTMRNDFRRALTEGRVTGLPMALLGKTWSTEELATVDVLKLVSSSYVYAIEVALYAGKRDVVGGNRYSYQAMITDLSTGKRHVFGYWRGEPHRWMWETFDDPGQMQRLLEQRATPRK